MYVFMDGMTQMCECTALGNNLRCLRRVNIDWLALFRLVQSYPRN